MYLHALVAVTALTLSVPSSSLADSDASSPCAGLSAAERNMSLFVRQEDIERAVPLREQRYRVSRSNALPVLRGATIYVRAVPGLTVDLLQRIADCHVAEVTERAQPESWMSTCPLFVPGAEAKVRFEGGRFVVEVRGDSAGAAEEILTRSLQAVSRSNSSRTDGISLAQSKSHA